MNELLTKGIGHTEFKDSELGRIPKSWGVTRIGDEANKVGSGVTPRGGSEVYMTQGVKFIRSQNVHFDGLRQADLVFIDEDTHSKMRGSQVRSGDVLLNITGASIGRCAVVPDNFGEANVNQHVCIIRCNSNINNDFLNLWMMSDFGQRQIDVLQAGGNREGLNFQQIREIKLPKPPFSEQVSISSNYFGIQKKLIKTSLSLSKFNQLKKALMQDLLTGNVRVKVA